MWLCPHPTTLSGKAQDWGNDCCRHLRVLTLSNVNKFTSPAEWSKSTKNQQGTLVAHYMKPINTESARQSPANIYKGERTHDNPDISIHFKTVNTKSYQTIWHHVAPKAQLWVTFTQYELYHCPYQSLLCPQLRCQLLATSCPCSYT